jgi:magnesium transporter
VIRAWVADANGARAVAPEEAVRAAKAGTANAWIDLDCETEETARPLLAPLAIHPLALEDMVTDINRPKVDDYGDYLYVAVHSARWDEDKPTLREIDMVLGMNWLVTYHDGSTRSIASAHDVLARRPTLLQKSPALLMHYLLDNLVSNYLPLVDGIAEELDGLEEMVMERDESIAVQQDIMRMKRGLSALRRIVGPQRDTILALTRDEFRQIPPEIRPYLRDVYDRIARITDLLDSFRDETGSLLELYVSIVSNRLNIVIKRLTVVATIGLPLTIVTSYYGMNFALPEYQMHHAVPYVLGVLAATAGITWLLLWWRKWL